MDLRDYEQKKFAIAEILRVASRLIPDKGTDREERLRTFRAARGGSIQSGGRRALQ